MKMVYPYVQAVFTNVFNAKILMFVILVQNILLHSDSKIMLMIVHAMLIMGKTNLI